MATRRHSEAETRDPDLKAIRHHVHKIEHHTQARTLAILAAHQAGWSQSTIGEHAQVSRNRIGQIIKENTL